MKSTDHNRRLKVSRAGASCAFALLMSVLSCGPIQAPSSSLKTVNGGEKVLGDKYAHLDEFTVFESDYDLKTYLLSDGSSRNIQKFLGQTYDTRYPFQSCFAIVVTESHHLTKIFNEKGAYLEGSTKDVLVSSTPDFTQLLFYKDCASADRTRPSQRFYLEPKQQSDQVYYVKTMALTRRGEPLPLAEGEPALGEFRIDLKRVFNQIEPLYLCGFGADLTSLESLKQAKYYDDKCDIMTEGYNENLLYIKHFLAINKSKPATLTP